MVRKASFDLWLDLTESLTVTTFPGHAADPNRIYQLTSEITPPVLIDRVTPRYPNIDARLGREGRVIILVVVEKDGTVSSTKVLKSVSTSIDNAAVDAVRKWLYRPASLDGRPVRVSLVVSIDFALRE